MSKNTSMANCKIIYWNVSWSIKNADEEIETIDIALSCGYPDPELIEIWFDREKDTYRSDWNYHDDNC